MKQSLTSEVASEYYRKLENLPWLASVGILYEFRLGQTRTLSVGKKEFRMENGDSILFGSCFSRRKCKRR